MIKIVGVRMFSNIDDGFSKEGKIYWYICPFTKINVNDWVLASVKRKNYVKNKTYEILNVGQICKIKEINEYDFSRMQDKPTGSIYGTLKSSDFLKQIDIVKSYEKRVLEN